MSKSPEVTDSREQLRRLVEDLDEEPPGEEETRQVVAALGIDVPAVVARLRARVAAYDAAHPGHAAAASPLPSIRPPPSEAPPSVEVEPMVRSSLEPWPRRRAAPALAACLTIACAAGMVAIARRSPEPAPGEGSLGALQARRSAAPRIAATGRPAPAPPPSSPAASVAPDAGTVAPGQATTGAPSEPPPPR